MAQAASADVCDRTAAVRQAITAAVDDANACGDVTDTQLAAIASLDLFASNVTALKAGDFAGLSGLFTLNLGHNRLRRLPRVVFANLTRLETLQLHNNELLQLPGRIFAGLTALTDLRLENNLGYPFGPSADAGPTQANSPDDAVTLNGTGGKDPWGRSVSFSWAQTDTSGVPVTLEGADTASASFTAPAIEAEALLEFTLTVTAVNPGGVAPPGTTADGDAAQDPVYVTVLAAEPVTVSFFPAPRTATEGGSAATVVVRLDGIPRRSVTIPLTATPGGGADAGDWSAPEDVTFGFAERQKFVTVVANDDDDDDDGESVALGFGVALPAAVTVGSPATATVTLVDNDQPVGTSIVDVAITSDPGSDARYVAGDTIQVTVTFEDAVTVTGTPRLTLAVGTSIIALLGRADRHADYSSGSGSARLVFAYTVQTGDSDPDGVSIGADSLDLNGGTITDSGGDTVVLAHAEATEQSAHRVDAAPPAVSDMFVEGSELTIRYNEALDESSVPASTRFQVQVQGSARTVSGVVIEGKFVTLDLASPVEPDERVRVGYSVPTTNPLRDLAGLAATAFSNKAATNYTLPTVSIAALDPVVYEGEDVDFTLTRDGPVSGSLNARVRIEDRGDVFDEREGYRQVTFAAGDATAPLTLSTRDDHEYEPLLTEVVATVEGEGRYTVSSTAYSAAVAVKDNDVPETDIALEGPASISEAAGWVTVELRAATVGDEELHDHLTVRLSTVEQSAIAGTHGDFASADEAVQFRIEDFERIEMNGAHRYVATAERRVAIHDDTTPEGDETFALQLRRPGGVPRPLNLLGTPLKVTILDNDAPGKPANVEATVGDGALTVSWGAVAGATGYRVQWKSGTAQTFATASADGRERVLTGGSAASVTIGSLVNGTEYTLRVIAFNSGRDGPPSDEVKETPQPAPPPVTGITVTAGDGELTISWSAVANATGYRVQWRSGTVESFATATADGREVLVAGNGATAFEHTIPNLVNFTGYTVRIIATNDGVDALPSPEVMGRPVFEPVPPPPGTTLVSNTGRRVDNAFNLARIAVGQYAQGFRTGPHASGYVLDSVGIRIREASPGVGADIAAYIYTASSTGGLDLLLHTLAIPSRFGRNAVHLFTAPPDAILQPNTHYLLLVLAGTATNTLDFKVDSTLENAEDAGALDEWSIDDAFLLEGSPHQRGQALMIGINGRPFVQAPVAANSSVTTAEDAAHTFSALEFGFTDSDGDTLAAVTVVTLPSVGTFALGGTAVTANQAVPKSRLDAGELVFTPAADANGSSYATFTFTVSDGALESASAATMTIDVTAVNDAPTGAPAIEGTPRVGQTLTASRTGIGDVDGLPANESDYAYQWYRVDGATEAAISGATSRTYQAASVDAGQTLKVKVGFTDGGGTSEEVESAQTAPVGSNQAPVAANSSVTTAEDAAHTFSALEFGFTDSDGDTLAAVTVVTLPSVGTFALGGTAVTANQAVPKSRLDAGELVFTPAADANGSSYATFTFTVSDGALESASAATMTIDVTAVNDAPTGAPAIEGTPRVGQTLTASRTGIGDVDGLPANESDYAYQWYRVDGATEAAISGATSRTYQAASVDAGQTLKVKVGFTDGGGTSEEVESAQTAPVGSNQAPVAANSSVTTAEDAAHTFSALEFGFTDSDGDTLAAVTVVTLPSVGTFALGGTAVTANQAVPKSRLDAGELVFTPAADANGSSYATFTFTVSDGALESASAATMTIDVTAVNDAPTGAPAIEGTPRVGQTLTASRTGIGDVDGLPANESDYAYQWYRVDGATEAAISGATSRTYQAASVDAGQTLKVKVGFTDGGGTSEEVESAQTAPVGSNQAPVAANSSVTTAEDAAHTFSALEFGFTDSDGDTLAAVTVVTLPSVGTFALGGTAVTANQAVPKSRLDAGELVFTPAADANGSSYATFTFTVSDGALESASAATMTIDVTAVNDAPTGAPAIEGTPRVGQTLTASRTGIGDVDGLPANESDYAYQWYRVDGATEAAISGATSRTYQAASVDAGQTLKVKVGFTDGGGTSEEVESAQTAPVGSNQAPVAANSSVTTAEDAAHTFSALEFGFTDSDGDTLAAVTVVTLPSVGTFALGSTAVTANQAVPKSRLDAGELVFTPAADANGSSYATFTFTVSDGALESASAATMTIDVTAVNDAPTGAPAIEGTPRVGQTLTASRTGIGDVDGLPANESDYAYQWYRVDGATEAAISGATSRTYQAASVDAGQTLKVKVGFTDGGGTSEEVESAQTAPVGSNQAPVAANSSVTTAEDAAHTFSALEFGFTDSDGDTLAAVTVVTLPSVGTFALGSTAVTANQAVPKSRLDAGELVFTPAADANGSSYATFTFTVSDGALESASAATMTIDVTAVNDAPTGAPAIEGTPRVGQTLTASRTGIGDVDGLPANESDYAYQWYRVDGATEAAISGATSRTYQAASVDAGQTLKVKVGFTDGGGTSEEVESAQTAPVGSNQAPVAANSSVTTAEDAAHTFSALEFGFTDSDGDTLAAVTVVTLPSVGTFALGSTAVTANQAVPKSRLDAGELVFTPAADANGSSYAAFTFTVSDGALESASAATMTIDVTAVNDAPTGAPAIEGTPRVGQTLTANTGGIVDPDGKPANASDYTYRWVSVDMDGTSNETSIGTDSSTYTPVAADAGKRIRVKVSFTDNEGSSEGPLTSAATAAVTAATAPPVAPAIVASGVQVTSTPQATSDTYGRDETIELTVTFDRAVTVGTGSGTPRIEIRLRSSGSSPVSKWAQYSSGSGTPALVFSYVVQSGDRDDNGIWLRGDKLELEGGTIRDATDTADANLDYAEPRQQDGHKVDGSLTADTPAIVASGVQVSSTPRATSDTYGRDETIELTVTFDRAVAVGTGSGTPRIEIRLGSSGSSPVSKWAQYSSGSGTPALVFSYVVQSGDRDDNGIWLRGDKLELEGGTIRDATDTVDANLDYAEPRQQDGHKVDGSRTPPVETGAQWELRLKNRNGQTIANNPGATVDNPVEGRLEVFYDTRWGTVCDDRFDGDGGKRTKANIAPKLACTFMGYDNGKYAPGWGQPNVSLAAQPIWLDDVLCEANSTHWTRNPVVKPTNLSQCWFAGERLHNCTHQEDAGVQCWNESTSAQQAAEPATITAVEWGGDANGDGRWNAGESVQAKFTFDAPVTVDTAGGTPSVALLLAGAAVNAAYSAGSGTETLVFAHRVADDADAVTTVILQENKLSLNGGRIAGADGTDAALQHGPIAYSASAQQAEPEEPTEPEGLPLSAQVHTSPGEHDGSTPFRLRVAFSQPIEVRSADMKQRAYDIEGGEIMVTWRVQNDSALWNVKIRPHGTGPVRLALGPTTDCAIPGAVCTGEGVKLTSGFAHMVQGPPALSVAAADVREGPGAVLAFRVTLDRAPWSRVTVDYATSDGTAAAGADYTATSGTLAFAAGETEKTVSVPVLDDDHDEGSETLKLTLSNATGAHIAVAEATGTIMNSDPLQQAWLARFGRTVAGHVLDAVDARLKAPRSAGFSATLGGQALPGMALSGDAPARSGAAPATEAETREAEVRARALSDWLNGGTGDDGDEVLRLGSRTVTGRELVLGSSFSLTGETPGGGTAGFWGWGAVSGFDGREGDLSLDGEVTTGLLGADYGRGRWLVGLIASHSRGEGSYRGSGAGTVSSTVTGLHPWARYAVSERLSVWGVAGYGAGTLTVDPEGEGAGKEAMRADLSLALAAAGARGELLEPPGEAGGPALALAGDAMFVRTESGSSKGEDGNLAAAEADVSRLRLALDGSWRFALEGGAALTPSLEVGVRHDGGDAETGFGVDVGGGFAFAAPRRGLAFDVTARTLVAHQASGFRERGMTAALTFDPRPSSDRGLALSLRQTLGASSTGGADALLGRETLTGLGANDNSGARRLELTAGYGIAMFGGRFTGTPEIGVGLSDTGRDCRLGWRLALGAGGGTSFELELEARRREPANDDEAEHTAGFRLTARY